MALYNIDIQGNKEGLIEVYVYRQLTPSGKPSTLHTGLIKHKGLKVEKKFYDSDITMLGPRLTEQARKWVEEWENFKSNQRTLNLSQQAQRILVDGIICEFNIDWEKAKDKSPFEQPKPVFKDEEPLLKTTYPKHNILDRLIKSRYKRILLQQRNNFEDALGLWKKKKAVYENELRKWEKDKQDFHKRQKEYNQNIGIYRLEYKKKKPKAVEWYTQIILEQHEFPLPFRKRAAVEYRPTDKLLVVEYFLPDIEDYPKIKETKYLKTKLEYRDIPYSARELKYLYENMLYQITLRIIYDLFKMDRVGAVDTIVFNGWVNSLNKATGKRQNTCILSILVGKKEYLAINFRDVDAKSCFKLFKGIAASELSKITPIPPILKINREDRRFIEERQIGGVLDDSANIAAMDWQDFEHLIREIFEKEFISVGGEVKVTQSSRDKGVDAVAFDPDPIRGGKVIIQAKRYTNTVHIESVRALYGIMQDEGAMKGVLVTTSDFGSDAYDFAKNKPISLIGGGNLLAMLHKHGYKGKIDIKEAKEILGEPSN